MGEAGERIEASDDADFTHGSERKEKKKKKSPLVIKIEASGFPAMA